MSNNRSKTSFDNLKYNMNLLKIDNNGILTMSASDLDLSIEKKIKMQPGHQKARKNPSKLKIRRSRGISNNRSR